MRIQTTLSPRAKITRAAIAVVILAVVVAVGMAALRIMNATGSCQATYIDHTAGGSVTKSECAR